MGNITTRSAMAAPPIVSHHGAPVALCKYESLSCTRMSGVAVSAAAAAAAAELVDGPVEIKRRCTLRSGCRNRNFCVAAQRASSRREFKRSIGDRVAARFYQRCEHSASSQSQIS